MLSKVINVNYPTHPMSQLKIQLKRTYQSIVHQDSKLKFGPTLFANYFIHKVLRMLSINILQLSLKLYANNLDFCCEELFKTIAIVQSRNFFSIKPNSSFFLSINLFEEPFGFFTSDLLLFLILLQASHYSLQRGFIMPPQPHSRQLCLGRMADGLDFMGIEENSWTFVADVRSEVQIFTDWC